MQKERTIKVKAGREKLREAIKRELARKGMRARVLVKRLNTDEGLIWRYAELDGIAKELRYLAFQIRNLQLAKLATEEA